MSDKSIADIVAFAHAAPERSSWRPPADRVLSGDPLQTADNYYTDPTGRFSAGIWECAPGLWSISTTEEEFCLLLQGRVVLTDAAGGSRTLVAGDAFTIPAGFVGSWETVETVRKYYVIMEAAKAA